MKYDYSKMLVTMVVLAIIFSGFYSNFHSNNKDDKRVMDFTTTTITISSTFVINESTIDPLTGQHGLYGFNEIVNVVNGGSLIVKNATIYFVQDSISPVSLNIYNGGSLILINSTLTVSPNRYFPDVFFTINDNGGSLKFLNSKVEYPGWFNVSYSNSVYFKNTIFTSLPSSTLSILQSFDPTIDISNYSFGPTPYFLSGSIYMINVSFPALFHSESSGAGVPKYNSYVGTVNPTRLVGTVPQGQTTTIVNQFSLSNLNINPYTTFYNGTLIINYSTSNNYSNNSFVYVYAKNDLICQPVSIPYSTKRMNLTVPVSFYMTNYVVNSTFLGNQNNMFVNITGPKGGSITINYVKLNLYTDSSILNNFYYHNFNLISSTIYGKDVYLSINSNNSNGNPDKNFIFLKNSGAYLINLTIPKNAFYLDPPYYLGDQSSTIYIYRYIDLNVSNYNGAPLPKINVTYYSNILPIYVNGNVYTTAQQVNSLNTFIVNQIPAIYNTTNAKGIASIPVLSDIVQNIFWPNALYVGNYNLTLTQGGRILKNISVSVNYFPNLNVSGNNAWRKITLVVPDIQVNDLIVPPFLVHGKTYSISAILTVLGENVTNVPVIFYLNGKLIGSINVNIPVNKNTTATINYFDNISVPGNYTLSVKVNPYMTIYESNYSNNYMETVVKMYPNVDLYVNNLSFSNFMLYSNSFLNFTVINNGTDGANNVTVNLVLSEPNGSLYRSWSSNFLPGQAISYSLKFYPTYQGTYYANVSVIYYWDINKSNNFGFVTYPGEIDFYPVSAWYNITGNVSYNSPMPLKITVEIGVKNIVPSQAPTIQVEFYDLTDNLVLGYSNSYYMNGNIYANLSTNFLIYGKSYSIQIILNSNMAVSELNYSNDVITLNINYPYISDENYITLGPYMNGTVVPIYTNLTISNGNIGNLTVIYIFPTINIVKTYFYTNPGNSLSILYNLNTSNLNFHNLSQLNITYEVVATYPGIYPYYVILQQGLIIVKQKPNIMLSYSFIPSQYVKSLTNVPQNTYITLLLNIKNTGGWTAYGNTTVYLYNNDNLLEIFNVSNLSPGGTFQKYVNITAMTVGNNNITIVANYNSIPQVVQGPRVVHLSYTTIPPAIKIIMYSTYYSFYSGDNTTLTFFVINVNATEQQGRNVYINNITLSVTVAGKTYIVPIGENNMGSVNVKITKPGIYQVYVSYELFGNVYAITEPSELIVNARPFSLPVWLIAIIVVVALIAGFFGYSLLKYKKQSKHLMVCGNCGSLIPEDAEKCPVCGVVFEKDYVKCGNCGSWIKKDAKYCPVCGTVYLDKDDPEYSKYVSLRNEYLLDIQKYKDEAERDLGHKFTDQEFYSWWANKPEFLTFEKWLEKKEEENKPTVECPVCHTLNPKGAKFCKVCGSPLPQEEDKK